MSPQLQDRPRPWADWSLFPIIMGSALPPRDPDDDEEEEEEEGDEDTDDEPPVVREPDE